MKYTNIKFWLFIGVLFLGLFSFNFLFSSVNAETGPSDNYQLLQSVENCVVKIETDFEGELGVGTGTIVSEDGYILTARHVLENRYGTFLENVVVQTPDGEKYQGYGVAADKEKDLAVIKVDGSGFSLCNLGNSEQLRLLDYILVVGYPYRTFSATEGKISGILPEGDLPRLQFTAPIASGNSGGPVFNSDGEVVGVVAGMIPKASGFNYARPVNIARRLLPPYAESIPIETEALDFGLDGTLYYIGQDGGIWSWKLGEEEPQNLHSGVGDTVDIAVDRRYIYFVTDRDGPGALKMYSRFDEKVQTVVDGIENLGQVAVGPNRDVYYTQSGSEDQHEVMVWLYESGNVEQVFPTQAPVEALAVNEQDTVFVATASAPGEAGNGLITYQTSTSEKERFRIDLSPILDFALSRDGNLYLLAGGEESGVFALHVSEPLQRKLLKGGNYSNMAFDNLDNMYLSTGEKVLVIRDVL